MTIKELYDWADELGLTDKEIGIETNVYFEYDGYCKPSIENDVEYDVHKNTVVIQATPIEGYY